MACNVLRCFALSFGFICYSSQQDFLSCVSWAFVAFVFRSLLIGCQSFTLLFVVQCFETLPLLGGHHCPASLPQSGIVKIGHQEDTPTSVSCQKGLPRLVTAPSPTSTGRASIIRSVASVFAFLMFMVVLLSLFNVSGTNPAFLLLYDERH